MAKKRTIKAGAVAKTVDGNTKMKRGKPKVFKEKPSEVHVGMGSTLNMGNYESLRLSVDVTLPCAEKDLLKTFKRAVAFCDKQLDGLINEYRPAQKEESSLGD